MPRPSAFNSTHFSRRPPHGEVFYREMFKSLGDNYDDDFDGLAAARIYAFAMAFARAKYAIERAGQQFRPTRVLEMLPALEREYGLKPSATDSIATRRAELVVAARLARGARYSNVTEVFSELFGDDFVAYFTVAIADVETTAGTPQSRGVYVKPGAQRSVFRTLGAISTTGSPVTVQATLVAGLAAAPVVGSKFVIDPGDHGRVEAVTVAAASLSGSTLTLTATFAEAHNAGALIATGRHANEATTKRHNVFVMTAAAVRDARTRRRAHRAAHRLLRGVSTWSLTDSSGPFKVGVGALGITTIGEVP